MCDRCLNSGAQAKRFFAICTAWDPQRLERWGPTNLGSATALNASYHAIMAILTAAAEERRHDGRRHDIAGIWHI